MTKMTQIDNYMFTVKEKHTNLHYNQHLQCIEYIAITVTHTQKMKPKYRNNEPVYHKIGQEYKIIM